jgi:hypothetical protein
MAQTGYTVQGNPIVREEDQIDEIFTPDQIDAIEVCAANIDAIVAVATQTPVWLTQGQASADAAAQSASDASLAKTAAETAASSARSSSQAAASSASAAGTSSTNAANSASAANTSAQSASADADRAEAAADSNPNNPSLVPPGGSIGDTLYKNDQAGDTSAPLSIWGFTRKNLNDMNDVDYDVTPQLNDRLTWTGGGWNPRPATSSTTLAGLGDVLLTSPQDGQSLVYETVSLKWKNKTVSGGGGGATFVKRGADITGPASYTITSADFDVFHKCNVAAGDVTIIWNDQAVVPAGFRASGLLKLTGANGTNKVRFQGGSAAGGTPGTVGTPINKSATSGVSGQVMTTAQNVIQSGTIPQGLKCTVAIVYSWIALSGLESVSPGFIWQGNAASPETWDSVADSTSSRMHHAVAFMYVGDIGAGGLPFTWQPQWTDYGTDVGRVVSYVATFIPFYNSNQFTPYEGLSVNQSGATATSITQTLLGSLVTGAGRVVQYVAARRSSNSVEGLPAYTGATQQTNFKVSTNFSDGAAMAVAWEAAAAPGTDNQAVAASNGTTPTSVTWGDIRWAWMPAGASMNVLTRANKAAEMVDANQMCAWLYDPEQKLVDLVF